MFSNEARKRYQAFWDRDSFERCILYIATRRGSSNIMDDATIEERWTDMDRRVQLAMETYTNFDYYAEGFPSFFVNFGPGSMAPCVGGNYVFHRNTVWFDTDPLIKDWKDVPELVFDKESSMWKLMATLTEKAAKASNGLYCASVSDIGGSLDILASLRGSETLLYDLMDHPEEVLKLHDQIDVIWKEIYSELYKILRKYQKGVSTWVPLWCEKSYYTLQCDFCAMISPDMFKTFVKPYLVSQTEFLEHSIYHLDGPDAVKHLDDLLDIPRLDGIQWSPGDGKPQTEDESHFDMYNKILSAGKGLVLVGVPFNSLENILKNISTKGLYLQMRVEDEKQAKEAIKIAQSYGVK